MPVAACLQQGDMLFFQPLSELFPGWPKRLKAPQEATTSRGAHSRQEFRQKKNCPSRGAVPAGHRPARPGRCQQVAQGGPVGITGEKGQAVPIVDQAQDQGGTVAFPDIGARAGRGGCSTCRASPSSGSPSCRVSPAWRGAFFRFCRVACQICPIWPLPGWPLCSRSASGKAASRGRDAARVIDVGMAVDDGVQTGAGIAGQQGEEEFASRVPGAGHAACGVHEQGSGTMRQTQQDGLRLSHVRDGKLQPGHQTVVQTQGRAHTGQQQSADEQAFSRRRQAGASGPQGQCQKKGRPWRAGPSSGAAGWGGR